MKQLCARLLVIAVLGGMLAMSGCILGNSDLVITEKVCVTLTETQTTGTFSSFVVCDQFQTELEKLLDKYDQDLKDVKSIHMVDATYKVLEFAPHDWNINARVDIARQDVPDGPYDDGIAPFVKFHKVDLSDLKGDKVDPKLHMAGVKVVNRALKSLLAGEDPRLVLLIHHEEITPTPSLEDPMSFSVETCVKFQIVLRRSDKD